MSENIAAYKCEATLAGHSRKINLITFNEYAEGILASTSHDSHIFIWDIEKSKKILDIIGS